MFVTLSLSNTSRARSCAFAFASSASVMPSRAHAVELLEQRRFDARRAACPRSPSTDTRVEKRLLGRQQRAGHRRRQAALDERAIEPRAALRRRHAEARPEVQSLRAGQHGVEHQQREEVAVGRPPARDSRPSDTPSSPPCGSSAGARRSAPARRVRSARRRGARLESRRSAARRARSASSVSTSPTMTSVALFGT